MMCGSPLLARYNFRLLVLCLVLSVRVMLGQPRGCMGSRIGLCPCAYLVQHITSQVRRGRQSGLLTRD
jgi:hypothetical protein